MDRRDYLATGAVIASGALSGCTGYFGETALGDPTTERDGLQQQLVYEHDDDEIVTVSVTQSPDTPKSGRLGAGIRHPDDITLENVQFRFTLDIDERAAVDLYLRPPPEGWYDEFDIYRDGDTIGITVEELGRAEFGDIAFHVLVYRGHDDDEGLPPVAVEHELTVSKDETFGETFVGRGQTTIEFNPSVVD